jgi:hypothetical protein
MKKAIGKPVAFLWGFKRTLFPRLPVLFSLEDKTARIKDVVFPRFVMLNNPSITDFIKALKQNFTMAEFHHKKYKEEHLKLFGC